jgi:hypothetical protein
MAAALAAHAKGFREALFTNLGMPGSLGDVLLKTAADTGADVIALPVLPPARGVVALSEGVGTFDLATFEALAWASDPDPAITGRLLGTKVLALARGAAWVQLTALRDGGAALWYADGARAADDQEVAEALVDDLNRASPRRLPWALLEAPAGRVPTQAAPAPKKTPRALRRPGQV